MKRIHKAILLLFFSAFTFSGCEKELDTEGISRLTFFADFDMKGDAVVTLVKGETFTDLGVTAEEKGQTLTVTKKVVGSPFIVPGKTQPSDVTYLNELDTNVPGVYVIYYSAKNSDGYVSSVKRYVFVLDKEADPAIDLSGEYKSGSSPVSTISKVADGVFYATNIWGGGSTVKIGAYIICTDAANVQVPQQESADRIFGYGTWNPQTGKLDMLMSRPTFPLINQAKVWIKS